MRAQDNSLSPSGAQYVIGFGHQEAVVTEVGATLRSYRVAGQEVVDGFALDEMSDSGRGQVLAPWPNRLADGRYEFGGIKCQAALDEPSRSNAIHGLVRWLPWRLDSRAQNVASLSCTLHAQPGYPWRIDLRVEYKLGRNGLVVTASACNPGPVPIPFGIGFHPYLSAFGGPVDALKVVIPGRRRLICDDRGIPTGDAATTGTEYDFTAGRVMGATALDTAFCALTRDESGIATVSLTDPSSGATTKVWMDTSFRYLMVYTADRVLSPERARRSIALEPMSCPPNALQTGTDLVSLDPGGTWQGRWGINFEDGASKRPRS
jgi:aldose 1-epimerase